MWQVIRHYDITGKNCPSFFVQDWAAQKFAGKSAFQAWDDFRLDVLRLMNRKWKPVTAKSAQSSSHSLGQSSAAEYANGYFAGIVDEQAELAKGIKETYGWNDQWPEQG